VAAQNQKESIIIATPSSRHIGLLDLRQESKGQFGDRDISWIVAACNQFLRKELKRLYPDEPVWTVEYYTSISAIDLAAVWPLVLVDDDGLPDALGHHYSRWGIIGAAVDCLGQTFDDIMSITLHELEMCFNPYIVEWVKLPDGRETPREAGDPVQWSKMDYEVSQKIGGVAQTRKFHVQNMVGARYWDAKANGDLDIKGEVSTPHQWPLEGYRVIRDGSRRYNEFGKVTDGVSFGARKFGPGSRTWSLLRRKAPKITEGQGVWIAEMGDEQHSGTSAQKALDALRKSLLPT